MPTRSIMAVLLLAISLSASATNKHSPPPPPKGHDKPAPVLVTVAPSQDANAKSDASATADANAKAAATAGATQRQDQTAIGGNGGQGGAGGAGGQANNAGNAQSISYQDRRQAPALSAPAVYASGPCNAGWSAGVSFPGGAVTGGKSKPDVDCDTREYARVIAPLNPGLALALLCSAPIVQPVAAKYGCEYVAPPAPAAEIPDAPSVVVVPQQDLSKYALKEEVDRAFKKGVAK